MSSPLIDDFLATVLLPHLEIFRQHSVSEQLLALIHLRFFAEHQLRDALSRKSKIFPLSFPSYKPMPSPSYSFKMFPRLVAKMYLTLT